MYIHDSFGFWLFIFLSAAGMWLLMGKRILSFEARERRRRGRSYGRVVNRRGGPSIRLAVKARAS